VTATSGGEIFHDLPVLGELLAAGGLGLGGGDGDPIAEPVGTTDHDQADHEAERCAGASAQCGAEDDEDASEKGQKAEGLGRVLERGFAHDSLSPSRADD